MIIEKNVADLAGYMYQPENSEYYNDLNIEKVSEKTADLIEKTINLEKIDIAQIQGLSKNAELKNISVYSFGYDCGGTRGYITYPVIYNLILLSTPENSQKGNNHPKDKLYNFNFGSYKNHNENKHLWENSNDWERLIMERGHKIYDFMFDYFKINK